MVANEFEHLRVLIADEQRERRELLAQVVAGLGHEVIAGEIDVKAVAALTAREEPDLALVEVGLHPQRALMLIEQIVKLSSCPVIALLAAENRALVRAAARRGVFASLVDASPDQLQSAIDVALLRFADYHNLQGAFARRVVIEQAKGILMGRNDLRKPPPPPQTKKKPRRGGGGGDPPPLAAAARGLSVGPSRDYRARCSASESVRPTSTRTSWRLYSSEPSASSTARQASAAAPATSSAEAPAIRSDSASLALTATGPTEPTAIRASSTAPSTTRTHTATVAAGRSRKASLRCAMPVPAVVAGTRTEIEQVALRQRRFVGAAQERLQRQDARRLAAPPDDGLGARCEEKRRRVGVRVAEAQVATERARRPHADVGDRAFHLRERGNALAHHGRALDLAVRRRGADLHEAVPRA